jgi:hypothetical protein
MKTLILALLIFAGFSGSGKGEAKCEENPQPDCFCILIYDPVCGCNKVTYGNACMAECAGITVYREGECKKKPKRTN